MNCKAEKIEGLLLILKDWNFVVVSSAVWSETNITVAVKSQPDIVCQHLSIIAVSGVDEAFH